ncbi:MAG: M20/M25/M40 family metallo-hydrolase [Chitinispirillales bacterium]|jgi:di/tripeptidase|nr:M20/M25/M40 family metallo-hydrolase [Chitinispirillales bacterium]
MKTRKITLLLPFVSLILFTLASCKGSNPVDCPHCEKEANGELAYSYFVKLSSIPRCTYNEKAASDYIAEFAIMRGFYTFQDDMSNLLIRKNGSKGRESEPPVILQAHIDMVCKKDEDYPHNFETDPIIPDTSGGWIRASGGTTLGADNGAGVSMIMAILASESISHPPIEALLTVQEEIGLVGALAFDVSQLSGGRLINLDCVEEKMFIAGSKRDTASQIFIPMLPEALAKIAELPDWNYKEESPLRDKMADVFKKVYGEAPAIVQINNNRAGVEPMAFAERMPHLDMVSIGPDILDIHTPEERMSLSSFYRVYNYLVKVLEEL